MASPLAERVDRAEWLRVVASTIADVCRRGYGRIEVTVEAGNITLVRKEITARQPAQLT